MKKSVSAVIVSYNVSDYVAECINALLAEGDILQEIIVVDNASSDKTTERIKGSFKSSMERINIIENSDNKGFAKAVNMGARVAKSEKLLIINPDAVMVRGSLARLSDFMNAMPDAGVVGPRILDKNYSVQSSARGFPDFMTPFFGRQSIWSRLIPLNPITSRNLTDTHAVKEPCVVDWVSGAVMMVRTADFLEAKGFDERFFMYWEDADFCLQMKKRGFLTYYFPSAQAVHFTGCSSKKRKFFSALSFYLSAFKYYYKNIRPNSNLSVLIDLPACIGVFLFVLYSFIKTITELVLKKIFQKG